MKKTKTVTVETTCILHCNFAVYAFIDEGEVLLVNMHTDVDSSFVPYELEGML